MQRPLGYRLLRAGLRAASRTASAAVDRALRRPDDHSDIDMPAAGLGWRRDVPREVEVRFVDGAVGLVERGVTVLEAARTLDVELRHYCGGNCSCGTCRVEILSGGDHLSTAEPMERAVLGEGALNTGRRLACQTRVLGPVTVRIPGSFRG